MFSMIKGTFRPPGWIGRVAQLSAVVGMWGGAVNKCLEGETVRRMRTARNALSNVQVMTSMSFAKQAKGGQQVAGAYASFPFRANQKLISCFPCFRLVSRRA